MTLSQYATVRSAAAAWQVGAWVREENVAGAAVRTETHISRYNDELARVLAPPSPSQVPGVEHVTGRTWAWRWRRFQGSTFSKLSTMSRASRKIMKRYTPGYYVLDDGKGLSKGAFSGSF